MIVRVKQRHLKFLVPRGVYDRAASVLDAFFARRAATINFVRGTKVPLHYHAAPLEGLRPLDAYHWMLLIMAHTNGVNPQRAGSSLRLPWMRRAKYRWACQNIANREEVTRGGTLVQRPTWRFGNLVPFLRFRSGIEFPAYRFHR
jgi:hypothetical protein